MWFRWFLLTKKKKWSENKVVFQILNAKPELSSLEGTLPLTYNKIEFDANLFWKFVEQLEYGLDNANPGYGFNGEELIGNEDDSESWYNSSTTDSRIRHQLPLLDGSPSLRKNRFFGFQVIFQNILNSNHFLIKMLN